MICLPLQAMTSYKENKGNVYMLSVWRSYEQSWWAEAAPRWSLEQSAAWCYWRGHQRV